MNKAEDGETMMMIVNAVTGARTVSSLSILSICITLSIHTIHTYRKLGSYPIWKKVLGASPKFGNHRVNFENQKIDILKPKSVGTKFSEGLPYIIDIMVIIAVTRARTETSLCIYLRLL